MIYVIYNTENIDLIDFALVKETSKETIRKSLDGTKCVLKFDGQTPAFLEGIQQYNYEEILEIMYSPEWTNNE
tara:strand:- start:982 stop:1200 length:219 start_codon:yes stop_codon:yes gene_type:complete